MEKKLPEKLSVKTHIRALQTIMKCNECKKQFIPQNKNAHNIKYCSLLCRNRKYYRERGGAVAQRDYLYKKGGKRPNTIQCLLCKRWYRQVGTHITQVHGITAREYREEMRLEVKRGILPPDLRAHKAWHALTNGTVRNLRKGAKYRFYKGQKGVGVYTRSPITLERLRKNRFLRKPRPS